MYGLLFHMFCRCLNKTTRIKNLFYQRRCTLGRSVHHLLQNHQEKRYAKRAEVCYKPSEWSSSSSESEYDCISEPKMLFVRYPHIDITEHELAGVFGGTPTEVRIKHQMDENGEVIGVHGNIIFSSESARREAQKLNGVLLRGHPIYVARLSNSSEILFVGGLNTELDVDVVKDQVLLAFQSHGEVLNTFLPKNSETGCSLGFGYIHINNPRDLYETSFTIDGAKVEVRASTLKTLYKDELEGVKTALEIVRSY
ncbi:unnamed protein product [Cochlearia groenlandica]